VAKKTIDLNSNPRNLMVQKTTVDGDSMTSPVVAIQPTASYVSAPIVKDLNVAITPFGLSNNTIGAYPNDTVQLNITNAIDQYLETNYRIDTYVLDQQLVTLDPEKDLSDLGYISGKYKTEYSFNRNLLGSGDAHKLQIQEISADGLEIRVIPILSSKYDNVNFLSFFESGFFKLSKTQTLTNLFLYKSANTPIRVFDYVQDKFTYTTSPYSIIFKLNAPVSADVNIGDAIWLSQQVSDSILDEITIIPPKSRLKKIKIAGPNWDAVNKESVNSSTQYKDWDDLLSTNTQTSQDIVNMLLSGSSIEGIPLNIDYKLFENHTHFGSAAERLHNFKYKLQLIENYTSRIGELTTGLTGLPSSSVSSSIYFQSNVIDAQNKRAATLGSLDGYEKYLYYESSSYVSSSYGEFYPTTWPKRTSTKPYLNYSVSSSQVEDWFDGIITSASIFDQNNDKALYRLIPAHVLEDQNNQDYVLFTQMMGHYYDLIFNYIKSIPQVYDRNQSILEGFSKELVYHISKNLGLDFENGNTLEELWSYTLGTNTTGSLSSTYGISTEDKTKEVWKRIVNNLPHLLKTKGTERGVRALINCFGIPQTILRIREYGGAEPEFDTKTDLVYERFNYSNTVGYNGKTSGQVAQLIQVPWTNLSETNLFPLTVEMRVKMAVSQSKTQTIFEVPNKWKVQAYKSGSGDYIGFFLSGSSGWATSSVSSSIYNGNFHNIALERAVANDGAIDQTYKLVVKEANYQKVVSTTSASLFISTALSSSYNTSFTTSGSLWIPGSGSFAASTSQSMTLLSGSIQEFRYWTTALQDSILDNHTLAPTSYQGNSNDTYTGNTSSYSDLAFRLCLGSDNKKVNLATTASIVSQHPNQNILTFGNGAFKSASFYNYSGSYYNPIVEIHSLEWPDLGGNRSISNKIRIDQTSLVSDNQLYRNNSAERSLTDNYPIESSRLGIYLSPVNEINQDIAEQFGGISIDDYIGNPADVTLDHYPDLEKLQYAYNKKYGARNNPQNYIRLIKHYDASLFKLIKKFVPYRANTQVGLVIEPDILHRSKISNALPTYEELQYSSSLDTNIFSVGGFVEDAGGEPFRDFSGYVPQGVVEESPLQIEGITQVVVDGTQQLPMIALSGNANEYNQVGINDLPSQSGSLTGLIDTAITAYGRDTRVLGSQYVFMTYNRLSVPAITSSYGSASYGVSAYVAPESSTYFMVTSSRYDYHEALNPVIMDSRLSQRANNASSMYDVDIYGSKAFDKFSAYATGATSAYVTTYTSSNAIYENNWTSNYGLVLEAPYEATTAQYYPIYNTQSFWSLTSSLGLLHTALLTPTAYNVPTAYSKIPAFFYKADDIKTHNYIYKITYTINSNTANDAQVVFSYGDLNSSLTDSYAVVSGTTYTNTIVTKANGPWLGLTVAYNGIDADSYFWFKNIKVECLNYRANVQDFHLNDSYGMRNARYDGCKMTSADFNVDSPDTIDKGPVVKITVGGGKQLSVQPSVRGNLQIR